MHLALILQSSSAVFFNLPSMSVIIENLMARTEYEKKPKQLKEVCWRKMRSKGRKWNHVWVIYLVGSG